MLLWFDRIAIYGPPPVIDYDDHGRMITEGPSGERVSYVLVANPFTDDPFAVAGVIGIRRISAG